MKTTISAFCLWGIVLLELLSSASAQTTPSQTSRPSHFGGRITDSLTGQPIPGATVEISRADNPANLSGMPVTQAVQTNNAGYFEFSRLRPGSYTVKISSAGYIYFQTTLPLGETPGIAGAVPAIHLPAQFTLSRFRLFMQPIEVKALRAGDRAPFTKTDIDKKQIELTNLGQDLPFLLDQTPSVVINSDAGNGVGYTGIHIRGTDDSRINMTLNGIPYNDAEEQTLFFVDLPDFASSVNSIQVQRGVGTSSNGAGAFGATINFSTNEFNENAYAEINNSYGSFNTWKNTIKAGSGLIDGHFTIDARLSRISSDGFIDRATSDLKSFYLSTAWYSNNSSLRFNIIQGSEKTYQAWNGIPQAKFEGNQAALEQHYENNVGSLYYTAQDSTNLFHSNNRTYNYFTYKDQTDNYQQNHYQLFFNHRFSPFFSLNAATFLTRGLGYYQEYHDQGDSSNAKYTSYGLPPYSIGNDTLQSTSLIRQRWLDNYFFGGIFSVQYKKNNTQITLGGGWDRFDGKHYGKVVWAQNGGFPDDYQYYYEPAHKTDFNVYAKWQQQLGAHWTGFADLQYRHINYQIEGFDDNPTIFVDQKYNFVNPKLGITYSDHDWEAYLSYSLSNHEPNRDDFEAGINDRPKSEMLQDFELSLQKKNSRYSWGVTGYYMRYHNQLTLTGQINDVGNYTRANIPQSYRLGVEFQAGIKPLNWFSAEGNLALSENKVLNYTEYDDDYDNGGQVKYAYHKTTIAFSPAVVGAATLNFLPLNNIRLSLISKYVSKEYLDNAQKEDRSLSGYYIQNLRAVYTIKTKVVKETNLIFQLNNVFNKTYAPNGYTYSYLYGGQLITENFLFPMAGTNFLFAVNIKI